jgi:O-6-methylguanine DNA methyltransferase
MSSEITEQVFCYTSLHMTPFSKKVYEVVRKIPKGETLTYKEVAKMAGRPGAARAVGNILNKNYDPAIPCHRVIRSDGQLGGYNRGAAAKRKILKSELATVEKF